MSLGGINIEVNSGDLQISKNYINDVDGDDTNMELDEVIIWEVKLPFHDVLQLYQGYNYQN